MKKIKNDYQKGRQKVVFDQVGDTHPGGVLVEVSSAKERFTDLIIPAGTMIIKDNAGTYKVFNDSVEGEHIGLTLEDIYIDDYPLVSVVMSGIARLDALPDKEKANKTNMKTCLPRISLV